MLSLSQFDLPLSSLSMLSDHIQQTVGAYDQRDCHQPRLLEVHQLGTELLGLALRLLDLDLLQDPTVRTSISSLGVLRSIMHRWQKGSPRFACCILLVSSLSRLQYLRISKGEARHRWVSPPVMPGEVVAALQEQRKSIGGGGSRVV
jgi:hypothetical protein